MARDLLAALHCFERGADRARFLRSLPPSDLTVGLLAAAMVDGDEDVRRVAVTLADPLRFPAVLPCLKERATDAAEDSMVRREAVLSLAAAGDALDDIKANLPRWIRRDLDAYLKRGRE